MKPQKTMSLGKSTDKSTEKSTEKSRENALYDLEASVVLGGLGRVREHVPQGHTARREGIVVHLNQSTNHTQDRGGLIDSWCT